MELLKYALAYARLGYAVLPLVDGGKAPRTASGLRDATRDPDVLREWFGRWPRANLGILPGPEVLVLDVDREATARALVRRLPVLKNAPLVRTRRGYHFFLRVPEGAPELAARTGILPGVDVRGLGRAYLVAPPSVVDGKRYRILRPLRAAKALPEVPRAILARARVEPEPENRWRGVEGVQQIQDARLQGLLRWATETVARTPPGQRHTTLLRVARAMGGYLHLGLDEEVVLDALVEAAMAAGLPHAEALRTARWAIREGKKAPLALPDRRVA